MRPFSVMPALNIPPVVSRPRTAHDVKMLAPRRRAASAIAGAAIEGSAIPSCGATKPPNQRRVEAGSSFATSSEPSSRALTWWGSVRANQAACPSTSFLVSQRYTMPVRRNPVSAPTSSFIVVHIRRLSMLSGISARSRPSVRHHSFLAERDGDTFFCQMVCRADPDDSSSDHHRIDARGQRWIR
jgi:hypothetical protein